MNRREVVLALLATGGAPHAALAQQEKRLRRIGYFTGSGAQANATRLAAFREGMAALRWVEGRDYAIDARYIDGIAQAAPGLANELIVTQPDLLLTTGDESAHLLAQRTKTIPIVFAIAQDPVGNGIVVSLRRPGGNATGLTSLATDLSAKRLQLLKEAFPRVAHVVLLFEPDNLGGVSEAKEIKEAALRLGMRITPIELRQPEDIDPAIKRGADLGAQAYILTQGRVQNMQRRAIAERFIHLRVPASSSDDELVNAGGLMSYSASSRDNFRRAATYVDKILKGAKPADLPVEQPTKFELVINMKTAKSLGVRIPQSTLLQATRLIE